MGQASLETWIHLVVWVAVLIGLVMLATWVVQRFRGQTRTSGTNPAELLGNFQEMRQRGEISDADYRKIKSVLNDKIQGDLSGGKDKH